MTDSSEKVEVSVQAGEVPQTSPAAVTASTPAADAEKLAEELAEEEKKSSESEPGTEPEKQIEPATEEEAAILKQVEFYFSDQNFPKDKFLWTTAEANDGWVKIEIIGKFSRMKRFGGEAAKEKIVNALRKSKELLEVDVAGERVRRKLPIVEPSAEEKEKSFASTVYVKGFPEDADQDTIEKFFEQFEDFKVRQIRMRRDGEKKFKGSVYAEFSSVEEAEKFTVLDPKPKYDDVELEVLSKKAYLDKKAEEFASGENKSNSSSRKQQFNAFKRKAKEMKGSRENRSNRSHKRRRR
ncbi:hypothetical protein V1511DRAFT_496109 [Dipodascopsis uninucleata]